MAVAATASQAASNSLRKTSQILHLRCIRTYLKPQLGLACASGLLAALPFMPIASAQDKAASRLASAASSAAVNTTREQDGLFGPVRRVRTETAKLLVKSGKLVEGPRTLLVTATYDMQGEKIDGAYYTVGSGSEAGKEEYKYDGMGNIREMTLRNKNGYIIRKELYTYEFDKVSNWTKMTTSVGVIEDGKPSLEAIEVTYRFITYYLDEVTSRSFLPAPTPTTTASPAGSAATSAPPKLTERKEPPVNTPAALIVDSSKQMAARETRETSLLSAVDASAVRSSHVDKKISAGLVDKSDGEWSGSSERTIATQNRMTLLSAVQHLSVMQAGVRRDNVRLLRLLPDGASRQQFIVSLGEIEQRRVGDVTLVPGDVVEVLSDVQSLATVSPLPTTIRAVFGGVLNGKAIQLPEPVYATGANFAGVEGQVGVEVIVDEVGEVISSRVASGHPLLHGAAMSAARRARFTPTTLDGQLVKVSGVISYNFDPPDLRLTTANPAPTSTLASASPAGSGTEADAAGSASSKIDATATATRANPGARSKSAPNAGTLSAEAVAYNNAGSSHYGAGRYKDAVEAYKQAAGLAPEHPVIYNNLGTAYSAMKRNDEAVKAFKRAISLKPDMAEAHYNLGNVYYNWGRYREAVKAFKQVVQLKPDKAEAYFGLGLAYKSLGEIRSAEKQQRILKELRPELADQLSRALFNPNAPRGSFGFADVITRGPR